LDGLGSESDGDVLSSTLRPTHGWLVVDLGNELDRRPVPVCWVVRMSDRPCQTQIILDRSPGGRKPACT
jgi:hypothetical protein